MKPKVLVISDYSSFTSARPEAEIFLGIKRKGIDVTIMTRDEGEYVNRFREAGIKVIPFHPARKFDSAESRFIRKELLNGGYNIMHLFNSKATINGIRAARGLSVKVVLYRGYTGNINWWDPTAYLKYLHPRVDKIVCLAESVNEMFQKALTLKKSKLITINKGHDVSWYDNTPTANLIKEGLSDQDFVLTCVANDRPMKGIPFLLEAISLIPKEWPVKLVLIGNGLDNPKYLKLIDKYKINDKIILTGFRKDSLALVRASHVFVLSSIKGEATTKSVIEAMSLEKPCLITDISGNRGLIENGVSGLVVKAGSGKALAEGIIRMFENRDHISQMGINARKRINEKFNTDTTVEKYKQLYEELIK